MPQHNDNLARGKKLSFARPITWPHYSGSAKAVPLITMPLHSYSAYLESIKNTTVTSLCMPTSLVFQILLQTMLPASFILRTNNFFYLSSIKISTERAMAACDSLTATALRHDLSVADQIGKNGISAVRASSTCSNFET